MSRKNIVIMEHLFLMYFLDADSAGKCLNMKLFVAVHVTG